jgi:methionine-rich copper-binding protein CopC
MKNHISYIKFPLALHVLLGLSLSLKVFSQPFSIPRFLQSTDTTGIAIKTKTSPSDDSVLATAPKEMNIEFPTPVRLVKLTLRKEERDWVDINFRYSPTDRKNYEWSLPVLKPAAYYTADWAILSTNDRLIRGNFSFSFGADAQRPSVVKAAEEELLLQRYGDPTIRYVPPPRTQIIINQDTPQFDPPFTINLNEQVDQ